MSGASVARAALAVALACHAAAGLRPSVAGAQDLNYQTFLIGDRALGMGGAFTGLADDAAAAWYNPAGLAQLRSSALSGSLSVNAFNRYVVEDGYGSPIGVADLEHDDQPSLPLFVGLVKKFGRRDAERVRGHAIAISTVHPTRVSRRFEVGLFDDASGLSTTLRVSQRDQVSWWGPSYAYRVSSRFALGASVFFVTRDFLHEEDEVIVEQGLRGSDGFFRNSTLSVRESVAELDAQSLVARLGVSWDLSDRLRLGLMVQPPAIQVGGTSRIFERRSFADLRGAPPIATFFVSDQGDLASDSPIPWEVRLGAAYHLEDDFVAVFDVSVHGAVGSESTPVEPLGEPRPDAVTGDTPQAGIFAVEAYHTELTANVSAGVESIIGGVVPVRAGVFTNFSAAPAIEGPSDRYGPAAVDGFGASFSVGLRSGGYDVALGAAGVLGFGTGYRRNPDIGVDPTPQAYLPADVESQTLYFFISGHKSAVSRLAREVYDEYLVGDEERERRGREARAREELERLRAECERDLREQLERARPGAGDAGTSPDQGVRGGERGEEEPGGEAAPSAPTPDPLP